MIILAHHNGFGMDVFPDNTKAAERLSTGQYLLSIVVG
jgi:hypothetical protein